MAATAPKAARKSAQVAPFSVTVEAPELEEWIALAERVEGQTREEMFRDSILAGLWNVLDSHGVAGGAAAVEEFQRRMREAQRLKGPGHGAKPGSQNGHQISGRVAPGHEGL